MIGTHLASHALWYSWEAILSSTAGGRIVTTERSVACAMVQVQEEMSMVQRPTQLYSGEPCIVPPRRTPWISCLLLWPALISRNLKPWCMFDHLIRQKARWASVECGTVFRSTSWQAAAGASWQYDCEHIQDIHQKVIFAEPNWIEPLSLLRQRRFTTCHGGLPSNFELLANTK